MANEQNLKPFKKGNQASKGYGRPKGESLTTVLRRLIDSNAPRALIDLQYVKKLSTKKKLTYNEVLALRLATSAVVEGDISAIKEIYDRMEGKASQPIEHLGEVKTDSQIDLSLLTDEELIIYKKLTIAASGKLGDSQ